MAGFYIDNYRPWPAWVVKNNEYIATRFPAQIGTYRGHADKDPGHDMSGDLAADFFLFSNTKSEHDELLGWFKSNAKRIGATYIITWRRIWSVARASEGVRAYSGSDPHIDHIHISYGTQPPAGGIDEEEDMPTPNEYADAVLTRDGKIENVWNPASTNKFVQLASAVEELGRDGNRIEAEVKKLSAELASLKKLVVAIGAKVGV